MLSVSVPARDMAERPARRAAGEEWKSARCERYQWSTASAPATGNTHRSRGTPAASAAAAEAAGVPRDRWVFPVAGADAVDHWYLSHRADFHSSPAARLAGRSAMSLAGTDTDSIGHLDLYSYFPAAVEIVANELGVAIDEARPLTVTGGQTFFGTPGSNYGTHAIATMVAALREDSGSLGMVTNIGLNMTKHSIGIYGTEPGAPTSDP